MKILIMTDMEGVAGIQNRNDWTLPEGRYHDKGKRLLTLEVNAAIEGLFQGGAREALVVDGHGPGGIDVELLDKRALLLRGAGEKVWPWQMDESFDGVAFVGQHAKAGTPYSHLTHTQSFHFVDLAINGVSIGEYGQLALCARELGVPTILACGEQALVEEAEVLTPGVVGVAVKRGILPDGLEDADFETYAKSKLSAIHLAPARARMLIRQGARRAIDKLSCDPTSFSYIELKAPYVRTARWRRDGQIPPMCAREEHPSSLIELMNMPFERKPI